MKKIYRPLWCKLLACILLSVLFLLAAPGLSYGRHVKDTLRFRKALAEKHALVMSDSALNDIGEEMVLLNKIENVHNTLTRILNSTSVEFDTRDIQDNFPEIDSNVEIIDDNLSLHK